MPNLIRSFFVLSHFSRATGRAEHSRPLYSLRKSPLQVRSLQRPVAPFTVPLVLLGFFLAVVLLLGLGLPPRALAFHEPVPREVDPQVLAFEVRDIVLRYYYREVDPESLPLDSVEAVLAGLGDPYSQYIDPAEVAFFIDRLEGAYSGIGVLIEQKEGRITVLAVLEGSPATAAGIRSGDVITAIDRRALEGMSVEQAGALMRGPEGSLVGVTLRRGEDEISLQIERRRFERPSVTAENLFQAGNTTVGYLRLREFSTGSALALSLATQRLAEQGATAFILDLRNNGGGFLEESVEAATLFVGEGALVVSTQGRASSRQTFEAMRPSLTEAPLVILVNGFSASASEVLGGAIKDQGRGILVGEPTFGKGSVQMVGFLSNGGLLKLTTALYYTPGGLNIEGVGIGPDIAAVDDESTPQDEVVVQALAYLEGLPR